MQMKVIITFMSDDKLTVHYSLTFWYMQQIDAVDVMLQLILYRKTILHH
jgi:hypothetical protein